MKHRRALRIGLLAASLVASAAWMSPAPDVVVYGEPMLDRVLHSLAAAFTARTAIPVHVFDRPGVGLRALLRHGARDDVMVAGRAVVAAAVAERVAKPAPVVALGADAFVFVTRADATTGASKAAMQLVVTDPTDAASFDGRAVLAKAGLASGGPAGAIIGASDTPDVVFLVQQSPARRGLVYRSDAVGAAHLVIAGRVAVAPTPIAAALVSNGQSRHAGDFLAFLQTPAARAILQHDGIEAEP